VPGEVFSVLSLSVEGITALLDRAPTGRESRLVRDLFAAATGRWNVEPALRQFDWPPAVAIPGARGDGAADRALRAFAEKELADHGCTLLMLGEGVASRLANLKHGGERLVIPDLLQLGRDSAAKRRIWAVLGRHRLGAAAALGGAPDPADTVASPGGGMPAPGADDPGAPGR
jgi:hypothetical protein